MSTRLAENVRAARKAAGLTQKKLAAKAGCSQTTISDLERNRNEASKEISHQLKPPNRNG